MKYVAAYRQTVAKLVCVEADNKEEAERKFEDAIVNKGYVNLTMDDWVAWDDEVRFIDNPTESEMLCAVSCD